MALKEKSAFVIFRCYVWVNAKIYIKYPKVIYALEKNRNKFVRGFSHATHE